MPLPREGKILDYSRWQQNLIGILQTDIAYNENVMLEPRSIVTLDTRLAYRNKGDADGDWKHYSSSLEQRELDCSGDDVSIYLNKTLRIFEFFSIYHHYFSFYPTNICTLVQRFHYLNWVHSIMTIIF